MASVVTLGSGKNPPRAIDYRCPLSAKRKRWRLGKLSADQAAEFCRRVQLLCAAADAGEKPDRHTTQWLDGLSDELHARLAKLGLTEPRAKLQAAKLGPFLDAYMAERTDVKPATLIVWGQTRRLLLEHFGADKPLPSITPGDGDRFKRFLIAKGLSSTTVSKRLQFARQFFRAAQRQRLIPESPFADVKARGAIDTARHFFVSEEDARKLLDAAPDADWRCIIALARFGGLRCPSEVLSVTWNDVTWADDDWAEGRLRVPSPKTACHAGHEERIIPLFPPLRAVLAEAFELAPEGATYIVGAHFRKNLDRRGLWQDANLRTAFLKIMQRAGLKPWPRLFHALRSSRQTELAREYPLHTVCKWLGNSLTIAARHYLVTTPGDFRTAAGGPVAVCEGAQQKAQHPGPETARKSLEAQADRPFMADAEAQQKAQQKGPETALKAQKAVLAAHEKTPVFPGFSEVCEDRQTNQVEVRGLGNTPKTPGNRGFSESRAAECAAATPRSGPQPPASAASDPQLLAFIERWPALSEATKAALAQLAGVGLHDDRGERDEAARRALKMISRYLSLGAKSQAAVYKLAKALPASKAARAGRKLARGVALPVPSTAEPAESAGELLQAAGESQSPANRLPSMVAEPREPQAVGNRRAAEVVPSRN